MPERFPLLVLEAGTKNAGHDLDGPASTETAEDGYAEAIEPLLNNEDLAAIFGRGDRTLRRWIAAGHLNPIRIGGAVFYHPADVRALIARRLRR